ncbi:SDR family NAD(P)-dependent oxidoreductase [Pedobacter hartonius]|uniref:NADP-dependent 3-hydroxy acid dehydrogenase YdfG n=1 Tax=Pedobacter hartonius TaxID=425514 RepID=A0A1H4D1M4_9SPHI|nr:SDR family NAD(P)-dependent oxidoreductase [Pedobacter hartonius]SEA66683.1 NADP-dependent 3-hydroxy acid dehydrogenase YdfG [Pedobacter hartonius]
MKNVVVTGVSTGIGRGTAGVMIGKGWHVFGSVRNEDDGHQLKKEFGKAFTPLIFDVQDNDAILSASIEVRKCLAGKTLDGLVNNAGSSMPDPLLLQTVEDFRKQIDINLVGMFAVTRAFAPLLGTDQTLIGSKGRIINLSSVAGKTGFPFMGAFSAAKYGVEGFSEALRRELQMIGIDVIIIGPGSVNTATWDKLENTSFDHVDGTIWDKPFRTFNKWMSESGRKGYSPEQVGKVIATALIVSRPHARYTVLKGRFLNATLPSLLPSRTIDRILGKKLGLLPK